jgi:uncharacterized protein YegP (UPF0339 family)
MEFLIFEDNGGDYRWRIIARSGGTLAESVNFASVEDAEQAARRVRDGVGSASFEPRAAPRRNKRDAWPRLKEWLDAAGSRIAVDRDRSTSRGCPAASTHGLARRARITRIRRSA